MTSRRLPKRTVPVPVTDHGQSVILSAAKNLTCNCDADEILRCAQNDGILSRCERLPFSLTRKSGQSPRKRNGMVLVLVLAMIVILALSSLGLAERMLSERRAVQRLGREAQARAVADSGVEMTKLFLERSQTSQDAAGGCYDNPQLFQNVLVADDTTPRDRGRFTIVAPSIRDRAPPEIRFGLEDESTRINLRTILNADQSGEGNARKMLMALPGMTESIADAILDWIDEDNTPRQQGAEMDAYTALRPAYSPRNGPPATIEELLLVRGVTPQLLFGLDAARMAVGAVGAPSNVLDGVDNSDGSMDHGWSAYLTLYSMESNLRQEDGAAKINLNDADLKKLYDDLKKAFGDQWATFIVAYRQNGPQSTGQPAAGGGMSAPAATPAGGATPAAPATPAGAAMPARPATFGGMGAAASKTAASGKLDLSKKPAATLNSVLDLIGVRTSVTFEGSNRSTPLDSPFVEDLAAMNDYLPKLLDKTTTVAGPAIPGRINVNQAPRCVLAGIPGMTPDALDQIISKRIPDPAKAGRSHRYETWILTEGLVPLATMKTMLPFINAGGCVYRVNVVGFFDDRGPIARLEVFLNAAKPPTSVLFWRDVSHVAIGYTPSLANPGNISANREQ